MKKIYRLVRSHSKAYIMEGSQHFDTLADDDIIEESENKEEILKSWELEVNSAKEHRLVIDDDFTGNCIGYEVDEDTYDDEGDLYDGEIITDTIYVKED